MNIKAKYICALRSESVQHVTSGDLGIGSSQRLSRDSGIFVSSLNHQGTGQWQDMGGFAEQ